MTITYAPSTAPHPWGESRRWNAWVELWNGTEKVASSADGDFALVGGQVTEDITRSISRDVELQLTLPMLPRTLSVAVYAPSDGDSFEIGDDEVGGDAMVGGGGDGVSTPAVLAATQRNPLVPVDIGDLLDPNSPAVAHIYAGWYGEEVRLGVFDLSSVPVEVSDGGAQLTVSGMSFERRLNKASFWRVETGGGLTSLTTVVANLVHQVISDVEVRYGANAATIATDVSWKPGDDRLNVIVKLLESAGMFCYFDRDNVFRIEQSPGIEDMGAATGWEWDLVDGINGVVATVLSAGHTFSDDETYNGVVIEGTALDDRDAAPVIVVRWNDNQASPLYFDPDNPTASLGGPRPKHITSDLVRTAQDAAAMATAELAKVLMVSDQVELSAPANANIQMGDLARFTSDALGVDAVYRISRVSHDLGGGPVGLTLQRFRAA